MTQLWVDKHRPKSINEYVFKDEHLKDNVLSWIKNKAIPNALFYGSPGTGKTSLIKLLLDEIGVHPSDIKFINASKERKIDNMRDAIDNFCSIMPYGDYRYVVLNEADYLTKEAQAAMRVPMEETDNVRFLLTCNYPNKLMPAIHSRCPSFHIDKMDKDEFTANVAQILINENIEFDLPVLDLFVSSTYPDLRKCINECQSHSVTGELKKSSEDTVDKKDYKIDAINLFKAGKFTEARTLVCSQISDSEYDEFYRFMYENTELWAGEDKKKTNEVILAVRDGLVKDSCVGDREINLAATLVNLELITLS